MNHARCWLGQAEDKHNMLCNDVCRLKEVDLRYFPSRGRGQSIVQPSLYLIGWNLCRWCEMHLLAVVCYALLLLSHMVHGEPTSVVSGSLSNAGACARCFGDSGSQGQPGP